MRWDMCSRQNPQQDNPDSKHVEQELLPPDTRLLLGPTQIASLRSGCSVRRSFSAASSLQARGFPSSSVFSGLMSEALLDVS
ncbi:unnamed protein product [Sphagnum troendelagicum]